MMFSPHQSQANHITQHYYRSGGDKPPLVLLHGFTDDATCWFPIAEAFTDTHDVIAVDARGHGKSARIAGIGLANEAMAEDVAGLIHALKLSRPTVMGHSMGAFNALILAAAHPELVGCLILEDPALTPPPTPEMEAMRDPSMRQWKENVRQMQALSVAELAAAEGARSPRWSAEELRYWAESKYRVDLDIFEARSPRPPWQSLLEKVACPVLLIYGDDPRCLVTPATAQEAAGLWKSGQAVQISHAGHCVRRDNPADFLHAVRRFLAEHGGA